MILRVKAEEMVRKWWECVWSVCCRPLAANRGRKLELRLEVAFKFMQRGFLFVFLLGEKQKPVNKQKKEQVWKQREKFLHREKGWFWKLKKR